MGRPGRLPLAEPGCPSHHAVIHSVVYSHAGSFRTTEHLQSNVHQMTQPQLEHIMADGGLDKSDRCKLIGQDMHCLGRLTQASTHSK